MSDKKIRRLGTWDSRKPGQSPKEMKKLLEKADETLKSTKMKPESRSQVIKSNVQKDMRTSLINRFITLKSSKKPESKKVRNPLTEHDRSTGGPRSSHVKYLTQKHYKSDVRQGVGIQKYLWTRTGIIGSYLVRSQNPMLRKSATDAVKDKVTLNPKSRYKQFLKETMPHTNLGMEFRTPNKQRILEGGSPKRSITARAGAGLSWLKRKYLSYGASHWRKSKTH